MLKITKATDPIEVRNITVCLYSPPGIGKTSMAFTADRPLLLDFDKGSYRSRNRRDTVQIETWADIMSITGDDLKPYGTVIVDTAGRALDVLSSHILKNNPKAANKVGGLSLQGFGELKTVFAGWTKLIRSFGLDVVLIAHSDEQKDGDEMRERLDIQGGSKNEIYKACDVMGRIYLRDGKRTLNFSPTDTAFGKNPAQLPALDVPDYLTTPNFLSGVIASVKTSLNAMSAEQVEVAGLLAAWKDKVDAAKTAADFNALLPLGRELDQRIRDNAKRVIVKAAKDLEIAIKDGVFVGGKEPAPEAQAPKADATSAAETATTSPEASAQTATTAETGTLDTTATASAPTEAPAEREVGSDDDDEADRKAAEPTAEEMAQMQAAAAPAPAAGKAKKGKAA